MYKFSAEVEVPSIITQQICDTLKTRVLARTCSQLGSFNVGLLEEAFEEVTKGMTMKTATYGGWTLNQEQVGEIAAHLNEREKIKAIKAFRGATRSGLKDAKNFLDQFGDGVTGAIAFLNVFDFS